MSITRSDDYRAAGAEAAEILLKQRRFLVEKQKIALTILVKRARVLRNIEAITGLRFDVDHKAPKGVAGYMTVADRRVFITESTLDDPEWAKYVSRHEAMHVHTGNCHLGFKENLPSEQFDVLKEEFARKNIDIKKRRWGEGFNDLKTIKAHGKHENSGYLQEDVPAAEKLDDLCIKVTGKSLLAAFGNRDLFLSRLRELSDMLLLQKTINTIKIVDNEGKEISSSQAKQIKQKLHERLPTNHTENKEDAERIVKKMFFDLEGIARLRKFFGVKASNDGESIGSYNIAA